MAPEALDALTPEELYQILQLRVTADEDRNLTVEGGFGEFSVTEESITCVMVPVRTENALRFSARLDDGAPKVRLERALGG
jgi:hypothetical protein